MAAIKKTVRFGDKELSIETGEIARQANSVIVSCCDAVVLVTVVAKTGKEDNDFFPLRVDYQEKSYAAGKIPGGFFKREGRPGEREILISRLIDRPIRPLFPKGFTDEVQIIATLMSFDETVNPDILAMIGASAGVAISGLPITEPMAAARVGYIDNDFVLNPDKTALQSSKLNLVVAGTKESVLMVESEAQELSEETMLNAILYGQEQFKPVIDLINAIKQDVNAKSWEWKKKEIPQEIIASVADSCEQKIKLAFEIKEKLQRQDKLKEIASQVITELKNEEAGICEKTISEIIDNVKSNIVRNTILEGGLRIDGRELTTIRPITPKVSILPRAHGSALFTRGETQAIVVVTLGSTKDGQVIDEFGKEEKETFMLHYNFPPYSVGEVGMVGSPKRREIGHGKLAKRSMQAVLPKKYKYVIRVVSEITESNGSSSMATVCGSSLALMDAGVPIKSPVAGIAMGLIKEENNFKVLSDILGDEDHLGDMDFKVAGTKDGVTALQMDIKIAGITKEIMEVALGQANQGRMHILNEMERAITQSRQVVSKHAPCIDTMKINPDKIRDVIGKGGATIKSLQEEEGVSIEIKDDGTVEIVAPNTVIGDKIKLKIEALTASIEVNQIYDGKVIKFLEFGAFVNLLPGKDGFLHISQISNERIAKMEDALKLGQIVRVKVTGFDEKHRPRVSMKALLSKK